MKPHNFGDDIQIMGKFLPIIFPHLADIFKLLALHHLTYSLVLMTSPLQSTLGHIAQLMCKYKRVEKLNRGERH